MSRLARAVEAGETVIVARDGTPIMEPMPRSAPCSMRISGLMILLDTQLVVWLTEGDSRLGPSADEIIATRHPAHDSAISVMKVQIKAMRGKPWILDATR